MRDTLPSRARRTSSRAARAALLVAFVAVTVATPTPATAADDGLRYESRTTYQVDIDARVVRVTLDATFTNELGPDLYFPEIGVPVLAEATNFVATIDGRRVAARRRAIDEVIATAIVDLDPDLLSGQTLSVRLTYDLPDLPPRSTGFTRVNEAFATFAAFSPGDEHLTSVEVLVPEAFTVEHAGEDVESTVRDGYHVLSSGPIADPATWQIVVAARNDDGLLSRALDIDGRAIVVRAWPGDDGWASFIEDKLRGGLPLMEELIGQDWPIDDELTIIEAASPYVYGYAGWFLPSDNTIEVGDALDSAVILHELSHLWFNSSWFADRWIGEAFAEVYAAATIGVLDESPHVPRPVDSAAPGFVALADWGQPALTDETDSERELYGYNASFFVLDAVADEVGTDALRGVIAAAADRTIAYRGDPPPERVSTRVDSRRLLDLLEEVAGSTVAAQLFRQYVFGPEAGALLDARDAARAQYRELVREGDGWSAPVPVRNAMAAWEFERAGRLVDDARSVLADREALEPVAAALELRLPAAFEQTYETSADLSDVAALADNLLFAADEIGRAEQALDRDRGPHETIGMWWSGARDDVDDARAAFERGDAEDAVEAARSAIDAVDGAATTGLLRIAGALAAMVLVAAAALAVHRRRRQHAGSEAVENVIVVDRG